MNRRRALGASVGAALGTAFLAACGGGGDSSKKEGGSSLVVKPVDTTKTAKRGGVFKDGTRTDATTFDVYSLASSEPRRPFVWSRLTKLKSGVLEPSIGEIEPDIAESWEFSPDKLQATFKLRANAKWDPRPPTSGRVVDAQDVVFSWERLSKLSARRLDYASIQSMSAPDNRTISMKLTNPDADLLTVLTSTSSGSFHILSKEVDGGYDIRAENRGSGPYYISEYKPSISLQYKKNPGYYNENIAFVDTWDVPIVTEYAQSLAQLRAGQVYRFPENLRLEDILPTKRDVPDIMMVQTDTMSVTATSMYGFKDVPASQFRDERVRQAYSMALDRDLWIDTFHNVKELESQGLPVETAWNSSLLCHDAGWWLDPQGKDFGPNAKFYKHDIPEAKKLLAAAGYANGFDTNGHYITTGQYGRDYERQVQVQSEMANEAGMRIKLVPHSFTAEWGPDYRDAKGNHDGIGWLNISILADAGAILGMFNSKGSLFKGFTPDGKSTFAGDPSLDDLTTKIKQEFDRPKRFAMAHELQRYAGQKQYYTRFPGGASGFDLGWPVIGNFGVYRGGTSPDYFLWIDPDKSPLKRA
jgi:peptide/nickel transport system substrate-binding protein